MKQKRWVRPVVVGFTAMYLVMMLLATYMTKMKFSEEFQQNMWDALSSLQGQAIDKEQEALEDESYTDEQRRSYYINLLSVLLPSGRARGYQLLSGAVYDTDGRLIAKTDNAIGGRGSSDGEIYERYFSLDMLTQEEKETLVDYEHANLEPYLLQKMPERPKEYQVYGKVSKNGRELYGIMVQKVTWKKAEDVMDEYVNPLTGSRHYWETADGKEYQQTGTEIVWEWNALGTELLPESDYKIESMSTAFPYIWTGKAEWERWNQSKYLRDFDEQIEIPYFLSVNEELMEKADEMSSAGYQFPSREALRVGIQPNASDGNYYYMELRSESHPWLAAMDYLKYVYFVGFALMLACMLKILYVTDKTYEQRAALEEDRRDFTNAMAHELKTPLGIIRGFAENLRERTMEEKRDYYLEQIIGQTEEMDSLVAKMIEISRLDSETLVLQQEPVSLMELCREQMKRLEPAIREKHLHVQYMEEEAVQITGDRRYLEKAIWNLLDNAVAYNVPDGSVRVICRKGECMIENTGFPMEEEQQKHAFDMFYSGDKSRSGHHLGMGLYLTKKILDRHGIHITIENMEDGVRVIIAKL